MDIVGYILYECLLLLYHLPLYFAYQVFHHKKTFNYYFYIKKIKGVLK